MPGPPRKLILRCVMADDDCEDAFAAGALVDAGVVAPGVAGGGEAWDTGGVASWAGGGAFAAGAGASWARAC